MSAFSTSPRPRIVNGVLIRECSDNKRHNGLQGTNSKEDFYRTIVEMPPSMPETDVEPTESESAACDLHFNRSTRQNCPNYENINEPAHFAQERNNISDQSKTHSAHCDHRRAFEPQESEQQKPSFYSHSNNYNRSTTAKLNTEEKQDRLDSNICREGKDLMYRGDWESGDHHRCTIDGSSAPNEDSSALNEEDHHHTRDSYCNTPERKYPCKKSSPKCTRSDSVLEECQENIHRQTSALTQDTPLTVPLQKTYNSTRLHEHTYNSSHGNTENYQVLTKSKGSCNPQNVLHEASPRENKRPICYETSEDLEQLHTSSPEYMHKTPQGCRYQDEQLERNQATAIEEFNLTEDHLEEFAGYPPQRVINFKQNNMTTDDEKLSPNGNLKMKTLRNKKRECHRFMRRKFQTGNITEQEARSVAELLNHPVVEVVAEESEVLVPQCSPPLRHPNSEEVQGYPPQLAPSEKSKYSVHRKYENDSQNEQIPQYDYITDTRQGNRHYDCSKLHESRMRAGGEHERRCTDQRSNVLYGNECDGHDESCNAYNETGFHHQHTTENECEEIYPPGSVQDTRCVGSEPYNTNVCRERSPRTSYPEAHEKYYHMHHSSNTPAAEINNLSVKKLPKEARCYVPVSCDGRESHFHQRDENLNENNFHRNNQELYEGSSPSSYRPVPASYEDGSCRKQNENLFCAPGHQRNENPTSCTVEHSDGHQESDENVSVEDAHSLHVSTSNNELHSGEQEECFAQSTRIPTQSYNNFEADHIREKPHPRASELNSKEAGLKEPSVAACRVNKLDDNTVSCHADGLCSPDRGSFETSGLNERCYVKPYRRYNGLEDEDNERTDDVNREIPSEEEASGVKKHIKRILQDARKNTTYQNKCETSSRVHHAHSKAGASEERTHPSNITSKTRIPKLKSSMYMTSDKGNTTAGSLQRSKRATTQKS